MTDPSLVPNSPLALHYRHVRTITGVAGMIVGIGVFVLIQELRSAAAEALLAKGCPMVAAVLPTGALQATYDLVIPVGVPLFIVIMGVQLFSPTAFGQVVAAVRTLLPWNKGP